MEKVKEMISRIAILNAESAKVNDQRSVNLGTKQTLESQFKELSQAYKVDYGVEITPENIATELAKETQEMEKEINLISGVLDAIQTQDYDKANSLLGIEVKQEEPASVAEPISEPMTERIVETPVSNPSAVALETVAPVVHPETSVASPVHLTTPVDLSLATPVATATAPQAPTTPTQPVVSQPSVVVPNGVEPVISSPVASQGQPTMASPTVPTSLSNVGQPLPPSGVSGSEVSGSEVSPPNAFDLSPVTDLVSEPTASPNPVEDTASNPALAGFTKPAGGVSFQSLLDSHGEG